MANYRTKSEFKTSTHSTKPPTIHSPTLSEHRLTYGPSHTLVGAVIYRARQGATNAYGYCALRVPISCSLTSKKMHRAIQTPDANTHNQSVTHLLHCTSAAGDLRDGIVRLLPRADDNRREIRLLNHREIRKAIRKSCWIQAIPPSPKAFKRTVCSKLDSIASAFQINSSFYVVSVTQCTWHYLYNIRAGNVSRETLPRSG
jgi:hypothetical protein